MYDQIAVALLKEQINKELESCLLQKESLSTIDNYIELVEKFQIEENIEKKGKIKTKILRLLGKDKTKNAFGGFTINEDLTDPTLLLISR